MAAQIGAPTAAMRSHEELFAYWGRLRKGGRLPGRRDLDPGAFKRLLPAISLIDVAGPADFRVRLAGTSLYDVYGREITGRRLTEIYGPAAAEEWRGELSRVVADRRPAAGVHNLAWRGASHLSLIWLRLPLAANGCDVDMILGYDALVGLSQPQATGIRAA